MIRSLSFSILLFLSYFCFSFQRNNEKLEQILRTVDSLYAVKKYEEVLLIHPKIKKAETSADSLLVAKINYTTGNSVYYLEDYYTAINYYNVATNFCPNSNEGNSLKGNIIYDKAFAEYYLNKRVKSYKTVKKAEAILSKIPNPNYDYLLSIYGDLGGEASSLGFYDEAEFYLQKGYSIYRDKLKRKKVSAKDEASKTVLFLYKFIYLYHLNGDEEKLLSYFKRLENYKRNHKLNDKEQLMYAASLNCVADHYISLKGELRTQKKLEKGNIYLEKAFNALKSLDKNKSKRSFIQFNFNKAKYYRYSKQFNNALRVNKELTQLAGENDVRIPFFVAQKGLIFLDSNQKEKALHEFEKMVQLIHADSTKLTANFSNFKPSKIVNHTGLLVEIADEVLQKHSKDSILKKQLHNYYKIGLQQFKNSYEFAIFNDKLKSYYHKAVNGILKTSGKKVGKQMLKNIINDIENIENKFAWNTFQQNKILANAAIPDSIFNKETFLRNQLVNARKKNKNQEVLELQNQITKHREFVKEKYPKITDFIYTDFNVAQFQKELKKSSIVIRYKVINDVLYVFKIDKKSIDVQSITFDTNVISTIEKYIDELRNREEDKALASKVFNILFPFSIQKDKDIAIVSDDILQNLPFETLINNNKYLIFDHSINYAAHLVFVTSTNQQKKDNEMFVFTPFYNEKISSSNRSKEQNLEGAKIEASTIGKLFKHELFKDKEASKDNFISKSDKASLLHLAMHANIDHKYPELSYFLFADDNKLYLEELYGLQLKADLAVLSACNTGASITAKTSLQRAFTLAGVPSTVSSLWEIPDTATKDIMIAFYKNLKKGYSKSKALQQAKIGYLKENSDINLLAPYYWAGFVVSGDDVPITASSNNQLIFWIVFAVILFVVLMVLLKRFQNR